MPFDGSFGYIDNHFHAISIQRTRMQLPGLAYASGISVLLPIAAGATKVRSLDKGLRSFLLLQLIYAMTSGAQLYLALHNVRNLWLSHLYNLVEYSLLMVMFSLWQKDRRVEKTIFLSIVFFALFWIIANLYMEPWTEPAIYSNSLSRTIYCVVGLYTLRKISLVSTTLILKDPRFWIISSLLISSTGDLMFYALRGVIADLSHQDLFIAFAIHWILNIITNLFIL
jgi:hypothetical protein